MRQVVDHSSKRMRCHAEEWISLRDLASALGITERAARLAVSRCLRGRTWRGVRLVVIEEHGRGGRSGARYLVAEHSLPVDLRLEHRLNQGHDKRGAARVLLVDELERLAAAHGRRPAIAIVLERANAGDLRPALDWAARATGAARELSRATLARWQRELEAPKGEDWSEMARRQHEQQLRAPRALRCMRLIRCPDGSAALREGRNTRRRAHLADTSDAPSDNDRQKMGDLVSLDKVRQGCAPAAARLDVGAQPLPPSKEAVAFMRTRTIKPQDAELEILVQRGELSRSAANLVSVTWDLCTNLRAGAS